MKDKAVNVIPQTDHFTEDNKKLRREQYRPSYFNGTKDVFIGSSKVLRSKNIFIYNDSTYIYSIWQQGIGKMFSNKNMERSGKDQKNSGKEEIRKVKS